MSRPSPPRPEATDQHILVACPWFRIGDTIIRTIILAAQFDTAIEVTLDELRIELIYPLDPTAERSSASTPERLLPGAIPHRPVVGNITPGRPGDILPKERTEGPIK